MGMLPLRPGGETFAPSRLVTDSADRLVNSTRCLSHRHQEGQRPVHDIGIVATGRFTPSGDLAPWCRTECLTVGTSTATVRFSSLQRTNWKRRPDIRGMACRLVADQRADGQQVGHELDLVAMTSPRFLVRREEDFHRLARPEASAPRMLGRLVLLAATRRSTFTALAQLIWLTRIRRPPRRGLAGHRYYGVHTFWLETGGDRRAVRYHWRPGSRRRGLRRRRLNEQLNRQLHRQLAGRGTIEFDLVVDLFDEPVPYRKTNDPLRRYPSMLREVLGIRSLRRWEGTTRVVAGRLTITVCEPVAERWVFNPVPAIGGFEPSDDEILLARGGAYLASHVRRRSLSEQ